MLGFALTLTLGLGLVTVLLEGEVRVEEVGQRQGGGLRVDPDGRHPGLDDERRQSIFLAGEIGDGLMVIDWLMEAGSDEAWSDQVIAPDGHGVGRYTWYANETDPARREYALMAHGSSHRGPADRGFARRASSACAAIPCEQGTS